MSKPSKYMKVDCILKKSWASPQFPKEVNAVDSLQYTQIIHSIHTDYRYPQWSGTPPSLAVQCDMKLGFHFLCWKNKLPFPHI